MFDLAPALKSGGFFLLLLHALAHGFALSRSRAASTGLERGLLGSGFCVLGGAHVALWHISHYLLLGRLTVDFLVVIGLLSGSSKTVQLAV